MAAAYFKTFQAMGLSCVPVRAESGAIGGNLSHEFAVLCDAGESAICYDKTLVADVKNLEECGV